jgi:pimeloyl-ACP methyl ester carboxylesterase
MNLAVAVALVCFVIVALVGLAYERLAAARDTKRYTPPGRRIDVGGYCLHSLLMGEEHDGPTVLLKGGAGGCSLEWDLVQRPVSSFVRVCSYDRAGYGWSDVGPSPRTARRIADELHMFLRKGLIPGPYILVGHSIGGYFVREFARRYADQVAGMVLVDSVHPRQWAQPGLGQAATARNMRLMRLFSHMGLLRFAAHQKVSKLAMSAETKLAYIARIRRGVVNAVVSEVQSVQDEGDLRGLLGHKPLVVVSRTPRDTAFGRMLAAFQADLLGLSSNSTHLVARQSDHYVHLEQPHLVVEAVRQVVDRVRQSI